MRKEPRSAAGQIAVTSIIGLALLLWWGSHTAGQSDTGPDIQRLEILPGDAIVRAGDTLRFTLVAWDSRGRMHTPPIVKWNAEGGAINDEGAFRAPARAGSYEISAMVGGRQAKTVATVVLFPPGRSDTTSRGPIEVHPRIAEMSVGAQLRFTCTQRTRWGTLHTPPIVKWDTTRGQVDATGRFDAPRRPSMARVSVTVGIHNASGDVEVKSP